MPQSTFDEREEFKASVSHSNLVRVPSLKISSLSRNSVSEVDETRLSRTIVALDLEFPMDLEQDPSSL
jgi:hypothetical protein